VRNETHGREEEIDGGCNNWLACEVRWRCTRISKRRVRRWTALGMGFPTVVAPRCSSDWNSVKSKKAERGGGA
jgi:hypothetical protein